MTYVIKRGKAAVRRKRHAHIARYDRTGQIVGALCPAVGFDMSSNVPWGLPVCKHCLKEFRRG